MAEVHLACFPSCDYQVIFASNSYSEEFEYVDIENLMPYTAFHDDFGPMNLASIFQFCRSVEHSMKRSPDTPIALKISSDLRAITNAVFLLGSFMILRLKFSIQSTYSAFESIWPLVLSYRDVSPGKQNFDLAVQDCWAGLLRAKDLNWVDCDPNQDLTEYMLLDDPLNADLHEIVPGKLIAMRGPQDIAGGHLWKDAYQPDGSFSHRDFSPQHYVPILRQFGVRAVVRLNMPAYDESAFERAGIAVADLQYEDCTSPDAAVVAKFLAIAEALPGALAVHCKAGLGRTGTLIALYMMRHHGFSARAAIGWLRVVRPGSVIGPQQHFLCREEARMMRRERWPVGPGAVVTLPRLGPRAGPREAASLIAAVCGGDAARRSHTVSAGGAALPPPGLGATRTDSAAAQPALAPADPGLEEPAAEQARGGMRRPAAVAAPAAAFPAAAAAGRDVAAVRRWPSCPELAAHVSDASNRRSGRRWGPGRRALPL